MKRKLTAPAHAPFKRTFTAALLAPLVFASLAQAPAIDIETAPPAARAKPEHIAPQLYARHHPSPLNQQRSSGISSPR